MATKTPKRFWLIEDDYSYRNTLKQALVHFYPETEIVEFSTEAEGKEAINEMERLQRPLPTLVVSDVQMPISFAPSGGSAALSGDGVENESKQSGLRLREVFRTRQIEGCRVIPWAFLTVRDKEKLYAIDPAYKMDLNAWHISKDDTLLEIKNKIDEMLQSLEEDPDNHDHFGIWMATASEETDLVSANSALLQKLLEGIETPLFDCIPRLA